jgi:hypothetical protein
MGTMMVLIDVVIVLYGSRFSLTFFVFGSQYMALQRASIPQSGIGLGRYPLQFIRTPSYFVCYFNADINTLLQFPLDADEYTRNRFVETLADRNKATQVPVRSAPLTHADNWQSDQVDSGSQRSDFFLPRF